MLVVAQYWSDQASDEVHLEVVYSERETPDLGVDAASTGYEPDPVNLPSLGRQNDLDPRPWYVDRWHGAPWTITLFAPFCRDFATQEDDGWSAYSPYAVFRRDTDGLRTEIVGIRHRPWLEGLMDAAAVAAAVTAGLSGKADDVGLVRPQDGGAAPGS